MKVKRRPYSYERYFECPFCGKDWGGQRRVQARGFHHQPKPLSEQDQGIQDAYRAAEQERDAHVAERHRPETIATRMREIEREATWAHEHATRTGEEMDWATDPLAIEWRALMREWWALPPQPHKVALLSPTYDRMLSGKGTVEQAGRTAGERHMSKVSSHQRKLRLARCQAA